MGLKQEELTQNENKTIGWRDFGGVNMTAVRTAIEDKEWAWLENAIPIGGGNVKLVPGIDPLTTSGAALPTTLSRMYGFVLLGDSVQMVIGADGSIVEVNVETGVVTAVAPAATVTVNARMTIWEDTTILIIDSTGYFFWDGTTFVTAGATKTGDTHTTTTVDDIASTAGLFVGMPVSGSGIPAGTLIASVAANSITLSAAATTTVNDVTLTFGTAKTGSAIAVFEGRVWIKTARRTIEYSAPTTFADFALTHGAGSTVLTDSVFVGSITNLIAALQQLWIIGEGAVNAISNVQTTGTPLATTFNNTNIVSSVGSNFPGSVSTFFRTIVFLTQYGIYAIVGATPQKLSDKLDGLFPDLTLTADCAHALGTVHNVFIWSVLVPYVPSPTGVGSSRSLLLCFAQGKWFFASETDLAWVSSVVVNGQPTIWGTDGETLFQLFADPAVPVAYTLKSKLFDFGDSTQQKLLNRLGLELFSENVVSPTVTVENESAGRALALVGSGGNAVTWMGSGIVTWTGSGGATVTWANPGLQLIREGKSSSTIRGQYLGLTLSGTEPVWTLSALSMEVRAGGKWNN